MRFFETWGRDIEVKFHEASGNDEAAQRADLVAVESDEAVRGHRVRASTTGLPPLSVLEGGLAQAKILVMGYAATAHEASTQEPYEWNASESQAGAINSAEVMGKQLVGKKPQYGGDDVKNETWKFGVVYDAEATDYASFTRSSASTRARSRHRSTSLRADPAKLRPWLATAVTKMKSPGVTTVVNLHGCLKALMDAADKQEWTPEWFYTVRGSPTSRSSPVGTRHPVEARLRLLGHPSWAETEQVTPPEVPYRTKIDPLNWYWGVDAGTEASRIRPPVTWLLPGIQAAGPKLTPQTFQQGLFALPPRGGAVDDQAYGTLFAWGKGPKLPYDVHAYSGLDFAPVWFDPDTTGPSNGVEIVGKGVNWFADGGKRYLATTWPTSRSSGSTRKARSTTSPGATDRLRGGLHQLSRNRGGREHGGPERLRDRLQSRRQ